MGYKIFTLLVSLVIAAIIVALCVVAIGLTSTEASWFWGW